jgi:hypothetical protein
MSEVFVRRDYPRVEAGKIRFDFLRMAEADSNDHAS